MNKFRVTFSDDEAEFHNQPQHSFITDQDDDEELFLGEKKRHGYFGDDLEEEVQADPLFQAKKHELMQKKRFNRLFCVFMMTVFLLIGLALVLGFSLYVHFKTYFSVEDNSTYCSINFNQTYPMDVSQYRVSRKLIQESFAIKEKEAVYLPYSEFPSEITHLTGFSIPEYYRNDVLLFLTNTGSLLCVLGSGHDAKFFNNIQVDNILNGEEACKTYLNTLEFVTVGRDTSYNPLNISIVNDENILHDIAHSRSVKTLFDTESMYYASQLISNGFSKIRNTLSQSSNLERSYKNTIVDQFYQSIENCVSLPLRNSWASKVVEEPIVNLYGSGDSQSFSLEATYSYFNNRFTAARTFVVGNNYTLDERVASIIDSNLKLVESNMLVNSNPTEIKELISNNTIRLLISGGVVTSPREGDLFEIIYKEDFSKYFISQNFFDWLDSPNIVDKFESGMVVGVDLSVNMPFKTDPVWNILEIDTKVTSINFKDTFVVMSDKAVQINKNFN